MQNGRNRSLDGLRAIAVLMVLLYHHDLLHLGWAGVDIFFVLSGFLITSILRRQRKAGGYWREYWVKRALRILPALVMAIGLTALLGFSVTGLQTVAYLLSFGDVLAYMRPAFEPLRPLWSLAVEEHFYLMWPFAIRYCCQPVLQRMLVTLIVIEPVLRCFATVYIHDWQFVYFLTPFRLDGLAMGCLLGLLLESERSARRIERWSVPAGAAVAVCWISLRLLLGNAFTRDNPTMMYNSVCYTLVAFGSASVLAYLVTHPDCTLARILSGLGLPKLGLISYGLYLYQVPVHEAVILRFPSLHRAAILVDAPLTLLLAAVSYYGVERRIMNLHKRAWALPPAPRSSHTVEPMVRSLE